MKLNHIILAASVVIVAAVAYAIPPNQSALVELPPGKAAARGGACMPIAAAATAIATDNVTAVSTAALTGWSCYLFQCDDDSYVRPGTAATGQDAASGDLWLPSGAWVKLCNTDGVVFWSFLNKNLDSACRYLECR